MLDGLDCLGLEVHSLDRARSFYEGPLGLAPGRVDETAVSYPVGDARLVLRLPGSPPRGGLHVHYAFSTPRDAFEAWTERLSSFESETFDFGAYRSRYLDDPDGHCVEIGNNGDALPDERGALAGGDDAERGAPPLTDVFEIVLEVLDLDDAETRYRALGFDPVDRGEERRRVRLRGPFDLELWEPQLGIADARGGVHVDLGLRVEDPSDAAKALEPWTLDRESVPGGVRLREVDGHVLTFRRP